MIRLLAVAFTAFVLAVLVTIWLTPNELGPNACSFTASGLVTPSACDEYMQQHHIPWVCQYDVDVSQWMLSSCENDPSSWAING